MSDSTYKTSRGRIREQGFVGVFFCGSTAQISTNDDCAVSGMYLTRGPIEEAENRTDNNVYWTSNQSASVNLADTVLALWDSETAWP